MTASLKVFTSSKQIASYHTYTRKVLFCFKSRRLTFKTTDGKVYDVAIKSFNSNSKKIPKRYFEAKISDKTFLINKNSFQKNVNFSKKLLACIHILKKQCSLEELMCVKSNIAPITQALDPSHPSRLKTQKTAFKIAVFAEKIKPQFTESKPVVFSKMNDGRPYVAYYDGEGVLQLHFDVSFISKKKNKLIGSGGFKRVYRYYNFQAKRDNIAVGIYSFNKRKEKHRAERELNFHDKFAAYSEIICPKATYEKVEADGKKGLALMVMKRFDGPFNECLQKYKRSFNLKVFRSVVHGTAVMHKKKYVHRDLKFQNVLYRVKADKTFGVKIIDLGLACRMDDAKSLSHKAGTNYYMPPEVVGYDEKTDPAKIDSWALGVMLYRIYFKKRIPISKLVKQQNKNTQLTHTQKKDSLVAETNKLIAKLQKDHKDDPWVQSIVGLIQPDPSKRMSAATLLDNLDDLIKNHLPKD